MEIKYFKIDTNREFSLDYLKSQWRKIAVEHHPDKGGSEENFKAAQKEYEFLAGKIGFTGFADDNPEKYENWESFAAHATPELLKKFQEIQETVRELGATLEVIGVWIWITGTSREMAGELKKLGLRWSPKKMAWYWTGCKVKSRGNYDLKSIRSLHGVAYRWEKDKEKVLAK